jgi:[ribosomal protein S5]-alanine N-acetyltransferase
MNDSGLVSDVPSILTPRLELISLSADFIRSSLQGRLEDAAAELGAILPPSWPDSFPQLVKILADLEANPAARPWLMRGMVLRSPVRELIGGTGFHDPPGPARTVEIGYGVEATHRRQGYVSEAVTAICEWAARDPGVDRILASVDPDNAPSLGVVEKLRFRHTGRRWDEEDGWELTFERVVFRP